MRTFILSILVSSVPESSSLHHSLRQQHDIRGDSTHQIKASNSESINKPKRHRELGWLSDLLANLSKSGKNATTTTTTTTTSTTSTIRTTTLPTTTLWQTVVNNNNIIPDIDGFSGRNFGSYNAPSVNSLGLVVFRARSVGGDKKERHLASTGGGPSTGVFVRNMSDVGEVASSNIIRQAGRRSIVPQPNNQDGVFIEFPSFPRISQNYNYIATRGNHQGPVWKYETVGGRQLEEDEDTSKVGTTGIYVNLSPLTADINNEATELFTAFSKLGAVGYDYADNVNFSNLYQVPNLTSSNGTALTGIVFDVFPGSPALDDYGNVATKGNYQKEGAAQTGVFYRNVFRIQGTSIQELSANLGTLHVVANSETLIPKPISQRHTKTCYSNTFGSTSPPSAAVGRVVFLGLDNETDPQCGGIYLAEMDGSNFPSLKSLIDLETKVPHEGGPLFAELGEVLSFDGESLSFWGAWGEDTKEIKLCCPTSGNKDLRDFCNNLGIYDPITGTEIGDTKTITTSTFVEECEALDDGKARYQIKTVRVNQGFFVHDGKRIKTVLKIKADKENDLVYWTYSGKPPSKGKEGKPDRRLEEAGDSDDAELPRWRSSAFSALSSSNNIMFKQTKNGVIGVWNWDGTRNTPVIEVGGPCSNLDDSTEAENMKIESIAIERDGYRSSRIAIAAACSLEESDEGEEEDSDWGGIYLRKF